MAHMARTVPFNATVGMKVSVIHPMGPVTVKLVGLITTVLKVHMSFVEESSA